MSLNKKMAGTASALAVALSVSAVQADVLFWSTQTNPVEEQQAIRDQVLADHGDAVDYQSNELGLADPPERRASGQLRQHRPFGALDGNFSAVNADDLLDLSDTGILLASDTFNDLAKLGTDSMQYIIWMQASYIMAANRGSLQCLPEGADIDALTYDQLIEWAANVHEAAGEPKFDFPADPKGLKHRFFQGYLYPSTPMAWFARLLRAKP